jgi:hypothetical protein
MAVRWPRRSLSGVLGWPAGEKVRTRGNRCNTGGNLFSADDVSWCATEKMRTCCRDSDGRRFTAAEAGPLEGFRLDYPWAGSRTRQFHQLADVVCPPVAAPALCHTPMDRRGADLHGAALRRFRRANAFRCRARLGRFGPASASLLVAAALESLAGELIDRSHAARSIARMRS